MIFNFNTAYSFDLSGEMPQLTLNDIDLQFLELSARLNGDSQPFLKLDEGRLSGARFDLASRNLNVEKLLFKNGSARVSIDAEKRLNLQNIVRSPREPDNEAFLDDKPVDQPAPEAAQDRPWVVSVGLVQIGGVAAGFEDQSRLPGLEGGFEAFEARFSMHAQTGVGAAQLKIQNLQAGVKKFRASRPGDADASIRVPSVRLEDGNFDLEPGIFTASRVSLEHGHVDVVRETGGEINLVELFDFPTDSASEQSLENASNGEKTFGFLIQAVELADFSTSIHDRTVNTDKAILDVHSIDVKLVHVDGKSPIDVYVDFDVDQGGHFEAKGMVHPSVPSVRIEMGLSKFALDTLQPYIEPHASIMLWSGVFSTRGMFRYNDPESKADLAYDGTFDVSRLNITDIKSEDTLLGWRSLKASNLRFRLNPDLLEIADVGLVDLDGKFIIAEDGTTNLSRVVKNRGEQPQELKKSEDASGDAEKAIPVFVSSLRVEDGRLYFADLSLRPQFATRIHNLDGVVNGISSMQDSRAQIQLDGEVDEYGMAGIKGEISLFDPAAYTDIAMTFRNLKMNNMTPYSGKFVGRRIDSGKLSLFIEYRIEDSELQGDNQIVLDNLKLGERVESKRAISVVII